MQPASLSTICKRATRSARSALTLLVATVAVLFSVHISACLAACEHDHHSAASLVRAAQADVLSAYNTHGRDLSAAASGGSSVVTVLPVSQQVSVVPEALTKAASLAFPLTDSRNTALHHHAVTVLLI
jgi:hypothetical protein